LHWVIIIQQATVSVPHQTSASGAQYAVSTKVAAKIYHEDDNGNDVKNSEEVKQNVK